MVKIMTDLSADLTRKETEELDIAVLPFYINCGDESVLADVDYTPQMFYEKFKSSEEPPRTSQATPEILENMYRELGKDEPIIHITIPANSSGIVNTARMISAQLNEEEGFDITVIDSSMYSYGIGANVIKAAEMAHSGASKDEISAYLRERFEKDRVYFIVDDLRHLQRGGRIKATTMVISEVLDIKPILWSNDGMVEAFAKVRGLKKAISKIVDIVEEKITDDKDAKICVLHADAPEKAETMKKLLEDRLGEGKVYIREVGPIITCHAGVGVFGLYFEHK